MSLTLLGQFCWCRLSMKVASTHWNCSVTRIIQTSLPVSDSTLVSIWITSTRRQEWCVFPSSLYIQFQHFMLNELVPCWFLPNIRAFFNSTGDLVGSWLLFIQNFSWLIKFWVHAWSWWGGLNKEFFILVHWRSYPLWNAKKCSNELDLQWTIIECSLFKPSHQLQACTQTYWTWEVLYAKQPTPDQNFSLSKG